MTAKKAAAAARRRRPGVDQAFMAPLLGSWGKNAGLLEPFHLFRKREPIGRTSSNAGFVDGSVVARHSVQRQFPVVGSASRPKAGRGQEEGVIGRHANPPCFEPKENEFVPVEIGRRGSRCVSGFRIVKAVFGESVPAILRRGLSRAPLPATGSGLFRLRQPRSRFATRVGICVPASADRAAAPRSAATLGSFSPSGFCRRACRSLCRRLSASRR